MNTRSCLPKKNRKKIIILGEGGVGKTTLLHRSIDDVFIDSTDMTIGTDFFVKKGDIPEENEDEKVEKNEQDQDQQPYMLIWDFAGQDHFRFILKDYLKGAEGVILCFNLVRSRTLRKLYGWVDLLKEGGIWEKENVKFFLVGTKNDLVPKNPDAISKKLINKFMKETNIKHFFKTSALDSSGVDELFKQVSKYIF